jgi:hypothetical protein
LLPAYAKNSLPGPVVSRPLAGDPPKIDLVMLRPVSSAAHNSLLGCMI